MVGAEAVDSAAVAGSAAQRAAERARRAGARAPAVAAGLPCTCAPRGSMVHASRQGHHRRRKVGGGDRLSDRPHRDGPGGTTGAKKRLLLAMYHS